MARILVVDDSKPLVDSVAEALSFRGHEVETATNVPDAKCTLRDKPRFDLIVLDWKMPGGGGEELMAHLPEPRPAVVIMTQEPDLIPGPPAPVVHVVEKAGAWTPAWYAALMAKVDDALGMKAGGACP
jgi:CheY-like chemotaxis protein